MEDCVLIVRFKTEKAALDFAKAAKWMGGGKVSFWDGGSEGWPVGVQAPLWLKDTLEELLGWDYLYPSCKEWNGPSGRATWDRMRDDSKRLKG